MEFLTDEAITDLTLPDQDHDMTSNGLSENDTRPQDAQPDMSEVVIDSIEAVNMEFEAKEDYQKDEASHSIATQVRNVTPPFLAFRSRNIDIHLQGPLSPLLVDGIPQVRTSPPPSPAPLV